MIAEPVSMVGDVYNDGIFIEPRLLQGNHQPADLMVNECDLSIRVGDDLSELLVALWRTAALFLAKVSIFWIGRLTLHDRFVPPGSVFVAAGAMFRQVNIFGFV